MAALIIKDRALGVFGRRLVTDVDGAPCCCEGGPPPPPQPCCLYRTNQSHPCWGAGPQGYVRCCSCGARWRTHIHHELSFFGYADELVTNQAGLWVRYIMGFNITAMIDAHVEVGCVNGVHAVTAVDVHAFTLRSELTDGTYDYADRRTAQPYLLVEYNSDNLPPQRTPGFDILPDDQLGSRAFDWISRLYPCAAPSSSHREQMDENIAFLGQYAYDLIDPGLPGPLNQWYGQIGQRPPTNPGILLPWYDATRDPPCTTSFPVEPLPMRWAPLRGARIDPYAIGFREDQTCRSAYYELTNTPVTLRADTNPPGGNIGSIGLQGTSTSLVQVLEPCIPDPCGGPGGPVPLTPSEIERQIAEVLNGLL